MRRRLALAAAVYMAAAGCAGFLGGGAQTATILVDFSHDEFNSIFIRYFPSKVTVQQGAELVFRQTWTGEPHTVTGGTLVDALMDKVEPYIEKERRGEPIPDEPPEEIAKLEEKVVWAFGEEDEFNQTGSQPCYLDRGEPRKDGKPCRTREQPEFTGKQTFYNSGIIPYEGPQGNEYRVQLSDELEPGSYWFYCIVHGEFQSTKVEVKAKGTDVPSSAEINRAALKEIDELAAPSLRLFRDAEDGEVTLKDPRSGEDVTVSGNLAGLFDPGRHDVAINEFIARRITAKAGEPITWNMLGDHSISFGVPEYFPIIEFQRNGTVKRNAKLDPPAGGAKKFERPDEEDGSEAPVEFDGGTYDGTGFWSSGVISSDPYLVYSMRITKPGTYKYACLIHPPMVGTVEVTA